MESGLPDLNQGQRTLAAIVVTDAVGFSARMSVDEEHTLKLIHQDLRLMEKCCQQHEGKVLKSTGDGLLMYFGSAVQAVSCSIKIQKTLTKLRAEAEGALLHRIGIHLGDVFLSQSDVMGNGVNIAARLQTQAAAGGICLSQVVYDVVRSRLALNAISMGALQLKNIKEPISAYRINFETSTSATSNQSQTSHSRTSLEHPTPSLSRSGSGTSGSSTKHPAPPRQILAIGSKVAGRYTIKQLLGQGGFGISYLAEDTQRFGELCVLKEFRPVKDSGKALSKAVDLFKREAKTLYSIDHPQIPKFMACFTQAQRLFIVIEYIDGVNYLKLLQQRKKEGRRFNEAEIVQWLTQIAQVLEYLHSLNIMHRDISPENVMFSEERNLPVLIDFGLVNDAVSGLFSEDSTSKSDSHTATVVGKFGYSPPEQIRLGRCYPSSDLYALGVTALVLMTGKHPRDLMNQDSLEWQWHQFATVGEPLSQILHKLTQQRPKDRFQSAQALIEALQSVFPTQVGEDLVPLPPPPPPIKTVALTPPSQSQFEPAFLNQCQEELRRCIGPMAEMVIEDALEQYPNMTPKELVDILANQISNADQVTMFLSHIQIPADSVISSAATSTHTSAATSAASGISLGPTTSLSQISQSEPTQIETVLEMNTETDRMASPSQPAAEAVNADFLDRCRRALTHCVGPMAEFLLEDAYADMPNASQLNLIERLVADIPDGAKAAEFKQQMTQSVSSR